MRLVDDVFNVTSVYMKVQAPITHPCSICTQLAPTCHFACTNVVNPPLHTLCPFSLSFLSLPSAHSLSLSLTQNPTARAGSDGDGVARRSVHAERSPHHPAGHCTSISETLLISGLCPLSAQLALGSSPLPFSSCPSFSLSFIPSPRPIFCPVAAASVKVKPARRHRVGIRL